MAIYTEDSYMKYDKIHHRYVITPQYLISEYGVDLNSMTYIKEDANPSSAADRLLNIISRMMYNYIYEYTYDKEITEYLLAGGNPEWREVMKEALGEMAYAFRLSGNLFMYETGLSLDKGKELSKSDISTQSIPIACRNILETNGLLFRGRLRGYNRDEIRKLKREGEF